VALTIYDIQKLKETNYEKGIVETFIRESDLLKVIPIETVNTLQVNTRRMNSLPEVTWRSRGERFSDGGQPGWEVVTDSLFNIGAEINIDEADLLDKGPYIVNPVQFNTQAKVKAIAYDLQDKIINGDHAVDPKSFEGLKVRVGNLASSQTIYAVSASAELDVRPSSVTTATAYAWLNKIEEAQYALDGHKADVCLTDADFIRALKNALRVIGQYVNAPGMPTTSVNQRETSNTVGNSKGIFEWDGVRYIDVGVKADQTTKIVANDTINSVACRPAYFVKLGGDYFKLLQMGGMDIVPPKETDDLVTYRGKISWYIGTTHVHNRFASVLKGSRVA
jgi:hypothetical protein